MSEEKTVRTDENLVQLRSKAVAFHDLPHGWTFTCDNCSAAHECDFAFDPYNTDGDCLAEK